MVVIVRGGGSQTDFKPFDDYELAKYVAEFPIPILTGIGHDRNISITDLMARPHKTPTKVASHVIENNFNFENGILELKERFLNNVKHFLEDKNRELTDIKKQLGESIKTYLADRKRKLRI